MSKITESARGEDCQVRIPRVCKHNTESVIWAHANGISIGKGLGMKSHDLLGAYCCFDCHNVYDRRASPPQGTARYDVEICFYEGHMRSLNKLIEKGLI